MAVIHCDEFVEGKRVEFFVVDPTGKTSGQIATEWQTLCDNKWPPASGYTRTENTITEVCAIPWPRWYLKRLAGMITNVTERCGEDGSIVIVVTISQP